MVSCIVLDGWHKGHVVDLPDVLPTISLLRPPVLTFDYCCDGEQVGDAVPEGKHDYQLAFYSLDRKMALYTTDGTSQAFEKRDWIAPKDKNWVEQPLHVGMHDPRSVIKQSPTKTTLDSK